MGKVLVVLPCIYISKIRIAHAFQLVVMVWSGFKGQAGLRNFQKAISSNILYNNSTVV